VTPLEITTSLRYGPLLAGPSRCRARCSQGGSGSALHLCGEMSDHVQLVRVRRRKAEPLLISQQRLETQDYKSHSRACALKLLNSTKSHNASRGKAETGEGEGHGHLHQTRGLHTRARLCILLARPELHLAVLGVPCQPAPQRRFLLLCRMTFPSILGNTPRVARMGGGRLH